MTIQHDITEMNGIGTGTVPVPYRVITSIELIYSTSSYHNIDSFFQL